MSLETGRSPIREGFGCHVTTLESMLRMMKNDFKLGSGHSTMETILERDKIRDQIRELFRKPREK